MYYGVWKQPIGTLNAYPFLASFLHLGTMGKELRSLHTEYIHTYEDSWKCQEKRKRREWKEKVLAKISMTGEEIYAFLLLAMRTNACKSSLLEEDAMRHIYYV